MAEITGNGNGRRFQGTISLGNILTIIGGLFIGAGMLVTVTLAWADMDKKIGFLQRDINLIKHTLNLPVDPP